MKLKYVIHIENKMVDNFEIWNNRFVLFDKIGRELNKYAIEDIPNYLEIKVLEIKKSSYYSWFISFPTTHIKLDILNNNLCSGKLKFGEIDKNESC